MEYGELLKDERWQVIRRRVLSRDGHQCQIKGCTNKKNLDVHHTFYLDDLPPWGYDDESLMTLCRFHHDQHHNRVKKQVFMLGETLKMKGFMLGDLLSLSTLIQTDFEFTQNLLKTLRDFQDG